jgi:hypothetical protein
VVVEYECAERRCWREVDREIYVPWRLHEPDSESGLVLSALETEQVKSSSGIETGSIADNHINEAVPPSSLNLGERVQGLGAMGGDYPPLSQVVPAGSIPASRTARILQSGVVLVTIVLLLLCSVVGTSIGVVSFKEASIEDWSASTGASQRLVLIAVSLRVPRYGRSFADEKVWLLGRVYFASCHRGVLQRANRRGTAPEMRLHANCFIVARLALVLWIIAILA